MLGHKTMPIDVSRIQKSNIRGEQEEEDPLHVNKHISCIISA